MGSRLQIRNPKRALASSSTLLGAFGTLVLHAVLLAPLTIGIPSSKTETAVGRSGNDEANRGSEFSTTLVQIPALLADVGAESSGLGELTAVMPSSATLALEPLQLAATQFEMDPPPSAPVEAPQGDDSSRIALFGNYTNQAVARVERAWNPPNAAIGSQPFVCRVRVEQERDGTVISVELLECDDNTPWQMSLVAAIERASPMPQPPDPSVFSKQLILAFSSSALPMRSALTTAAHQ